MARSGRERRKNDRLPLMMSIRYSDGLEFETDYSTNFSKEGLCLNTGHRFWAGEKVQLEFALPGKRQPIRTVGKVRWCEAIGHGPGALPAAGLEFFSLHAAHREAIDDFVSRMTAPNDLGLGQEFEQEQVWNRVKEMYEVDM